MTESREKVGGNIVVTKVIRCCPSCGGAARGRGYSHEDGCEEQVKAKAPSPPCLECGGAAWGRGYVHAEGCPNLKPATTVSFGSRQALALTEWAASALTAVDQEALMAFLGANARAVKVTATAEAA